MVFFALTRQGFDAFRSFKQAPTPVLWVAAEVLTKQELELLRASGLDVSDFTYEIAPGDAAAIQGAVETIKEHHPNACIWVEA